MKYNTHDDYIQSVSKDRQTIMLGVQTAVESVLPDAIRCIGYNMPAFKYKKAFFYFAVFKQHLGVYPPVTVDQTLIAELMPYRNEKGNLSFPYQQPIPYELIGRVAIALAKQYSE